MPKQTQPARQPADGIRSLESRNAFDRLKLLVHAMWSLIEESTELTEDDLARRIRDIDASDGNRNGYYRPAADKCECGAAIRVGALRCQFCGAEATDRSPFNTI